MITDIRSELYLHGPRGDQRHDDGFGLALVPARHRAEGGERRQQVCGCYFAELPDGQAVDLVPEDRNTCGVDVVAEVTRQSCRNLQESKEER